MFEDILKQQKPHKNISFFTILADTIVSNKTITEVYLSSLPVSYRSNIANLCNKLEKRRGIKVTYTIVGSKVFFIPISYAR